MVSTGPSTIESEITPISINKKGQILCKTRFTQNKMGSYNPMIVEYGFCILTNDSILEIKTKVLNPNKFNNEDKYYEELKYWDKIFRRKTSTEQLYTIKNKILKNNYNFTEVNTDQYKVDKEISIVENNDKGRQARKYFISFEKKITKEFIEAISEDESIIGGNLPIKTSRAMQKGKKSIREKSYR